MGCWHYAQRPSRPVVLILVLNFPYKVLELLEVGQNVPGEKRKRRKIVLFHVKKLIKTTAAKKICSQYVKRTQNFHFEQWLSIVIFFERIVIIISLVCPSLVPSQHVVPLVVVL